MLSLSLSLTLTPTLRYGNRLDNAEEKECKSVDATTTDIWCSTTCVNAHNCPTNLCTCLNL